MRFSVGIVGHGRNPHAACFEDVAQALADALRALGHDVVPPHDAVPGRLVMFGANNLVDPHGKLPSDAIVYNSEQVAAAGEGASHLMQNRDQFRRHVVWDYSRANIARLLALGMERVVHCPVGYVPSMTKIAPAATEDVDVLFYGSVNPRRARVLDALDAAGLKVVRLFGVYGAERDAWIARAKVVLNLHFYDRPVFEIFRVSHLLANKKCVVSEDGGQDEELERMAGAMTFLTPRDEIVEVCRSCVADADERAFAAALGFSVFKKVNFVESVRRAVEESAS